MDVKPDGQTQADRQTDRQSDRQRNRETEKAVEGEAKEGDVSRERVEKRGWHLEIEGRTKL